MAGARIDRSDLFPVGTRVAAYHRRDSSRGEGSPHGTPAATAGVRPDGILRFTGLEDPPRWSEHRYVPYAAYAQVDGEHRWLWFQAKPWAAYAGENGRVPRLPRPAQSRKR